MGSKRKRKCIRKERRKKERNKGIRHVLNGWQVGEKLCKESHHYSDTEKKEIKKERGKKHFRG